MPQPKWCSRWLSALLYALAACGLAALVLAGVAYYQYKKATAVPEYLTRTMWALSVSTSAGRPGGDA